MELEQAMAAVERMLTCQTAGHYRLSCNKGILLVRLRGTRKLLRFQAQDRVGFRFEPGFLIVEDVRTLAVRRKVSWEQIESVTAGEPESDNAELFQG